MCLFQQCNEILEILIVSFLRIECVNGHHCSAKKWLEIRVEYCSHTFIYRRNILNLNEETEPTYFFHMMGAFEQAMCSKVIKNGETVLSKSRSLAFIPKYLLKIYCFFFSKGL